jgi:hypothetical protein
VRMSDIARKRRQEFESTYRKIEGGAKWPRPQEYPFNRWFD